MKCAKCGSEIKSGNLYCSKCGAEVQIVSAYRVMEEEFFLDIHNRELGNNTNAYITPAVDVKRHKKKWYMGLLTAIVGFLMFVGVAWIVGVQTSHVEEKASEQHYRGMVQALAASDEAKALHCLEAGITDGAEKLPELFWMAWIYGKADKKEQHIETLQRILSADEENIYACRELIRIFVETDDFEALLDFYEACKQSRLSTLFNDYLVDTPTIDELKDPIWAGDTLTITAGEGLNIYYTIDGSSPITDGTLYFAPIQLDAGVYTIQASACNEEGYYSPIVSRELTVENHYQLGMPQIIPDSGEYLVPQMIYVTVPEGCSAYYTWNGSVPDINSSKYKGGISMPEGNNVLSVILVDEYGNSSSIQRVNYIYMP